MATNYPASSQTFTNPSGTSLLTSPDHAVMHTTENDTLVAIQTVMGTTAGTSVLKDFAAGQFPARVNSGGTIVQTLTGGTINSANLVTPTLGVATATTINKITLTQPASAGTLTIADGALLNASASGTIYGTNTGDQTNISGNAATVTTNANLTGDVTSVGNATSIGTGVIVDADVNASAAIVLTKLAITGTPTGAKFLRDDAVWTAIPGGGDALVANPLSQFAATTSLQFAGVISDETGTGAVVLATSPTLVTPLLGTPTSATLTNATGLPIATGVSGLAANVAGFLGTPSSANLASALTDETGSGLAVFATSPTISGATIKNMVDEVLTTGGSSTVYTLTPSVAIGSYVTGHRFLIKMHATCGASPTINISGLGAKNLTKSGATALSASDALIDGLYVIEYDGTQFQVSVGGGSAGSTAFVSNEVPSGSVNSSNVDFTAAASMVSASLKVYQNGVRLKGGGVDFTQGTGAAFSFVVAPTTGDLLLIDYSTSTGTYSTGSTSFVYNETPSGTVNGANAAFDTASTYVAGTIQVYRDGQLMKGGGADYTETDSNTITFVTAPVTGSVLLVTYQSSVSAAGNADTLDGYHANATPTASMVAVHDSSGVLLSPIYSPQGFLQNGKISVTVASNNITLAIKTLAGADATAATPIYVRIGDAVRTITAALSVTKNAGTNWFSSGSLTLATKEIDYFVYLGYNATDGVVIGFARISYASAYSDFSATTTHARYCAISTITTAASTDYYQNIGRFAATLSGTASFNWSVPTFSSTNLIQTPIIFTRALTCVPQWTGCTTTTAGSGTFRYIITGTSCLYELGVSAFFTSNTTGKTVTMPFPLGAGSSGQAPIYPFRGYDNSVSLTAPIIGIGAADSDVLTLYKDYSTAAWTNANLFILQGSFIYPLI